MPHSRHLDFEDFEHVLAQSAIIHILKLECLQWHARPRQGAPQEWGGQEGDEQADYDLFVEGLRAMSEEQREEVLQLIDDPRVRDLGRLIILMK